VEEEEKTLAGKRKEELEVNEEAKQMIMRKII